MNMFEWENASLFEIADNIKQANEESPSEKFANTDFSSFFFFFKPQDL